MVVDYISHRLLHTTFPVGARWNNIKHISTQLSLEDDERYRNANYITYTQRLCTLAVSHDAVYSSATLGLQLHPRNEPPYPPAEREYDLFAASCYFNKPRLIASKSTDPRCLMNRHDYPGFFGNAYQLAAAGGYYSALDLLLSKTPSRTPSPFDAYTWNKDMALIQASELGSLAMLHRILPGSTMGAFGQEPTALARAYSYGQLYEVLHTPSVAVFEMFVDLKRATVWPDLDQSTLRSLLERAAQKDWRDMVRHLVVKYAPGDMHPALVEACTRGHVHVVQELVERGAVLDGTEVGAAAQRGRWDVVRFLVRRRGRGWGVFMGLFGRLGVGRKDGDEARGVDINGGLTEQMLSDPVNGVGTLPIVGAVAFEREDVVREFVKLGARLDGAFGEEAIAKARSEGLDSMVVLLEELGASEAGDGKG
jgi:hypothetical protein